MHGLSLVAASRGSSLVAVRGLLIVVASLVEEHGLQGVWAQYLWHTGLVALQHVESSWTRDGTHVPLPCGQILNHWIHQGSPLFCSTDMLVFMPLPWDLIYHNLKSSSVSPPTVFFFFKIVLAVLGPLHFQINFRINVSFHTHTQKKACCDFAWDYIEFLGGEGGELTS